MASDDQVDRGPGRPKKPPSERRTKSLGVSLSPEEKETLEEQAEAAGLSQSEYMRRRAFGRPIKPQAMRVIQERLRTIVADLADLTRQARKESSEVVTKSQAIHSAARELLKRISSR